MAGLWAPGGAGIVTIVMDSRIVMDTFLVGLLSALALVAPTGCTREVLLTCENPQPATGTDHGFVHCDGGWSHRPEARECPSMLPRPDVCEGESFGSCAADADCTARANGACTPFDDGGCRCSYGCRTDADCVEGYMCVCGDIIGRCTPTACTVDADCGDALCASYVESPGCPGDAYACQSTDDQCASTADCPEGQECSLEETGTHRTCFVPGCFVGRPFLVEGGPRLAPPVARADWRGGEAPSLAGLDLAGRAALAEHWTRAGRMEHASIAAFARFALQLLAVGAPPRLLRDTHAAMADELEHARLCFALASAYAGRDLGPGALDVRGALAGDVRDFVATAIHEGCVGETVAALEASAAARHAGDPVVRAALERISADETRHAELAWRFVQWAVASDPALHEVAAAAFAAALAEVTPLPADTRDDLLDHGVLGPRAQQQLRRDVLTAIVAPCARALLPGPAASRSTASAPFVERLVGPGIAATPIA
jgi:hypothetical protein